MNIRQHFLGLLSSMSTSFRVMVVPWFKASKLISASSSVCFSSWNSCVLVIRRCAFLIVVVHSGFLKLGLVCLWSQAA